MKNKYYVPCIEEFRVGFEYEMYIAGTDTDYKKQIIHSSHFKMLERVYSENLQEGWIRVKYLDSSDIESCGFIKTKEYSDELVFQKNDGDYSFYELSYQFEDNKVCIEQWTQGSLVAKVLPKEEWNSFNLFCGTIKNLSELKVILKQIGVE